mgnify:CR=1 FL=1
MGWGVLSLCAQVWHKLSTREAPRYIRSEETVRNMYISLSGMRLRQKGTENFVGQMWSKTFKETISGDSCGDGRRDHHHDDHRHDA